MPKNIDADLLNAALLGLRLKRQAVDQRIAEVRQMVAARCVRRRPAEPARQRTRNAKAETNTVHVPQRRPQENAAAEHPPLATTFENRAGRYELVRVAHGQAYYSFTNRHGRIVDEVMPVMVWRRLQERAVQG
jgi:hypothetical protein